MGRREVRRERASRCFSSAFVQLLYYVFSQIAQVGFQDCHVSGMDYPYYRQRGPQLISHFAVRPLIPILRRRFVHEFFTRASWVYLGTMELRVKA
jgi:hypothetical protein